MLDQPRATGAQMRPRWVTRPLRSELAYASKLSRGTIQGAELEKVWATSE
jgi:hypothetical protein